MSLFTRFFGKDVPPASDKREKDEPLVLVPIPALGVLLLNLERTKGTPLTEPEVLAARDKAACIALPLSTAREMEAKRGYRDINPENVWPEWQVFRADAQPRET